MKKLLLTLIIPCILISQASTENPVTWHKYNDGMMISKKYKKPVIIDFYASWCGWCKVMDAKTFSDPVVAGKLRNNFVTIRIDMESPNDVINYKNHKMTPREFFQMVGGKGLPSIIFMDNEGNFITMVPGFIDKKMFLPLLAYINEGCYMKNVPFDQAYIEGKKNCAKK